MSSILTNTSAMTALQTLRSINSNMTKTQAEISTGKSVANAKDNAAVWAISKVMESDVMGFEAIQSSLALGESTVAVGRNAAETTTDLLTQMKEKIVNAQEENVDREKIQADVDALTDQIKSVVGAAQFNGLNLVNGFEDVQVLSSLDRASNGTVTASDITVQRQDLTTQEGALGTGAGTTDLSSNVTAPVLALTSAAVRDDGAGNNADIAVAATSATTAMNFVIDGTTVSFAAGEFGATNGTNVDAMAAKINAAQIEGVTAVNNAGTLEFSSTRAFEDVSVTANITAGTGTVGGAATDTVTLTERGESFTFSGSAVVNAGDGYQLGFGTAGTTYSYVANDGDSMEDVAKGLKSAIDGENNADIKTEVTQDGVTGEWVLKIDNDAAAAENITVTANDDANENAVYTGGLAGLDGFDVTTSEGAEAALDNVETLIQTAIGAAAEFGSAQGRIETQNEFVGKLVDDMKAGIGSLVDADMEAVSARLQALQVQQQLGVQSLSIANQSPQSILSLFR